MRKWILEETDEERILHEGDLYLFDDAIDRWSVSEVSVCVYPVLKLTEIKTVDDCCKVIRTMLDEIKKE